MLMITLNNALAPAAVLAVFKCTNIHRVALSAVKNKSRRVLIFRSAVMRVVNQSEFMDEKKWMKTCGCTYGGVEICDVSLSGKGFPPVTFEGSKIINCSFSGRDIWLSEILGCDIFGSSFSNINVNKINILGVYFYRCQFIGIESYDLSISNDILFEECSFKNVKMIDSFIEADFKNCDFDDVLISEISIDKEKSSFSTIYESESGLIRYCK